MLLLHQKWVGLKKGRGDMSLINKVAANNVRLEGKDGGIGTLGEIWLYS